MTKQLFSKQNFVIGIVWLSACLLSAFIGYQVAYTKKDPAFVPGQSNTVVVAKVPELAGFKPTWSGTGTLSVPSQVAPGVYLVSSDDNALGCVWQRLKAKDTTNLKNIIQNGLMGRGATPQVVTVAKDDKFLQFLGGCAFRRVS